MAITAVEPSTTFLHLHESSLLSLHRQLDRFSILRADVSGPLPAAVQKSCEVPAVLVSAALQPVGPRNYRLWVDQKAVATGEIPAFRINVIDLAATPVIWAGRGYDYIHFYLRRSVIDVLAGELGYARVGEVRLAVGAEDVVLSQIARSVLPFVGGDLRPTPLSLDQLELILAAHVMQRYGAPQRSGRPFLGGLSTWQRRRSTEILSGNLDGKVRLADLARECELSVSHFARSFKVSFGVTCHRWLTARRIERAKELLLEAKIPLAQVASQAGFGDQAAFTRTFHRVVGVTPGHWRRERGSGRR